MSNPKVHYYFTERQTLCGQKMTDETQATFAVTYTTCEECRRKLYDKKDKK